MINRLFFCCLCLFPTLLIAKEACKIDIQHGVAITASHIRVIEEYTTLVQYNVPYQVIIKGHVLTLNRQQNKLVKQYVSRVKQSLPEYNHLMLAGINLAADRVLLMASVLYKGRAEQYRELEQKVEIILEQANQTWQASSPTFVTPQSLYTLEQTSNEYFSNQAYAQFPETFKLFSTAIMQGYDELARELNEMDSKNLNIPMRLIYALELDTRILDDRAKAFCSQLIELDLLETQLQHQIPELADYNVFNIR